MEPEEFDSLMQSQQSPPVEEEPVNEVVDERADLLGQISEILKEHDGMESNIPVNHEYWNLTHKFRMLGK